MPTWRVNNSTNLGNFVCAPWVAATAYAIGDRVVCRVAYATTTRRAYVYECTTAGTSHATSEPVWPTSGTVADGAGALVWTTRSPNDGTWDNASCFLWYMTNHAAADNDIILVDDGHSETNAAVTNIIGGSVASGVIKIFCVDKATDGISTGALVYVSGSNAIGFRKHGYSYGVTYKTANSDIYSSNASTTCEWIFEGKTAIYVGGSNQLRGSVDSSYNGSLMFIDTNIRFTSAGASLQIELGSVFLWKGGSLICDEASISNFIMNTSSPGILDISDVDLSSIAGGNLTSTSSAHCKRIKISRCKLHANTVLTILPDTRRFGNEIVVHHCSSADRNYSIWENSYDGKVTDETTIVRTGGASNGTTAFSLKMISASNTLENIYGLYSTPINGWTDSTTEKTFTIEGVYDSVTNLQDDEIWMELEYPINNTNGLGGLARDKCAQLGTPADKTVSTIDWTTTGITNVNKFKLTVTVTPGKAGPITTRVCLAKASTTVYIDPVIVES